MIIKILKKYEATIVDVETVFLFGDLEEEVYMTCKEVHDDDKVLLLIHSIYGLVQSARQYYIKFKEKLNNVGFSGGFPDPCLMMKETENGVVYIAVWVDDSLLIGDEKAIEEAVDDLKKLGFNLKIEGTLEDYLSCEITFNKEKTMGWIHQPHLITKLEKRYGNLVKELQKYKTPSSPGEIIMRNTDSVVNKESHANYRSGVGMLLYLVKHTRPDIANPVRELSKALDLPSPKAYKSMLRIVKFVLDTRNLAIRIKPIPFDGEGMWQIVAFSDSDFAGDCETRISIAGFVLYLMGVPISWKSKGMKSVTLSSSEAEYVALSEAAKEVKFVYQVMKSLGLKTKMPIIIRVDNIGAIFMSNNVVVSQRAKHVDCRFKFVQEFVFDGFI